VSFWRHRKTSGLHLKRFLPRNENFFELLERQAELVAEAGRRLCECAAADGCRRTELFEAIRKLEEDGDAKVLEVYRRLGQTFLTPLDAEDIHLLAASLDDILDSIEESAYRLSYYHIGTLPQAVQDIVQTIELACDQVLQAVRALSNNSHILEHCLEINRYEDRVDQLVRDALRDLFEKETEAITLIKIKEILEILEVAADRCEDVSDALQNIVVKNS